MLIREGLYRLEESKYNHSLHERWEKKKNLGSYRLITFTLIPVKVLEQVYSETMIKHMMEK